MDKNGGSNVPIEGISDKRSITATFSVTLDNKFLPMQIIYKGKTGQSLPKLKFPNGFSLSANESHYSNENEALKFVEIILPYIQGECEKLESVDQIALLIFDVLRGQTTDKVLKVLEDNNILATKILPNMTHLFQPLDLTVNKVAKDFMKKKFSKWFSRQISIGLENGQELQDIQIDYRLSVLKPMNAKWLISFYDFMSSPEGKVVIIASGWRKSGILDAVEMGLSKFPVLDPFNDICPLVDASLPKETLSLASLFPQELESYRTKIDEIDDDESEWEVDDEAEEDTRTDDDDDENDDRNAFDIYGDE